MRMSVIFHTLFSLLLLLDKLIIGKEREDFSELFLLSSIAFKAFLNRVSHYARTHVRTQLKRIHPHHTHPPTYLQYVEKRRSRSGKDGGGEGDRNVEDQKVDQNVDKGPGGWDQYD